MKAIKLGNFGRVGLLLCVGLALTATLSAEELKVSNLSQLTASFASAEPGDTIVMKDGVWRDAVIDFNAAATALAPITLRAETSGKVKLTGSSSLIFSKPYLNVEGLLFEGGAIEEGSVITFNSDHCTLNQTAIINYNPEKFETQYYWVMFNGNANKVLNSYFEGKTNKGPLIGNADLNARYNIVSRSHFKDMPYVPEEPNGNGREIFRIWGYGHADETGDDGAYFTIEYNLFERAHGEGAEIVSLKSNYNIVRFNTVRGTRGGLVGRRGKFNTFEGNFILGEGLNGTTGIRLAGSHHRVINNYISHVEQDGIRLISGEYFAAPLTDKWTPKKKVLAKYLQVTHSYIAHNTLIDVGESAINLAHGYKAGWPGLQQVLLPEKNVIANNLIYQFGNEAIEMAIQDKAAPLELFNFDENTFVGNIAFAGKNPSFQSVEVTFVDPKLKASNSGLLMLSNNSPAIDAATSSYLAIDLHGKHRGEKRDVGAIEFADKAQIHRPLVAANVGPNWMK
tara:strand:- start:16225 stop:17751 length:1527 start_codon:yes stop_codon:yes gene_type:complete